ncbi:MAG: magnesium transporter, partial [Thermoplasmata archaeon]|nr:magnesium transporter [Thermoplasmata archaeon]
PLLALCAVLEIAGGQLLNNEKIFIAIPFLLTTIPVVNGLFGNLGCILGARLATGLHLGQIDLSLKNKELRENVIQTVILGLLIILFLTAFIWAVSPLTGLSTGPLSPLKFIIIMLGAGLLMTIIITVMSVVSAFLSFKKGIDPDNTVVPVVSTTGDLMGITTLIIMVGLVL